MKSIRTGQASERRLKPELSRRGFLTKAGVVAGASVVTSAGFNAGAKPPVTLGMGRHTYEWVPNWGQLPDKRDYGNTHGGIVIDSKERVYVNTDTAEAVMVFDSDGRFLKSWGQEFAGGLHGMHIVRNCAEETVFLAHIERHEVVHATLDGEVIKTLAFPKLAGVYDDGMDKYLPTGVGVAPDGSIFIGDGYGRHWVHKYDAAGQYVDSWGGKGEAPGQFRTPHGLVVDTRGETPIVIVADRENGRLQRFDLEGKLIDVIDDGMFRRPCGLHLHGKDLVVPDLAGRITILDENNKLFAHLGDQPDPNLRAKNEIGRDQWEDGVFLSPHSAAFDDDGNLYVMDWNKFGRVSKLRRMEA